MIKTTIANYDMARVLVDSRSSINILFYDTFHQMQLKAAQLKEVMTPLFGFVGHVVHPVRHIPLPLTLGTWSSQKSSMSMFLIVDSPSAYNVILVNPFSWRSWRSAPPIIRKIKFSIGQLVGEVVGEQKVAHNCYVEMIRTDQKRARIEDPKGKVAADAEVYMLEGSALK